MRKGKITEADVEIGDVVSFYEKGWRFDKITGIKKVNQRKPIKRTRIMILLERYGKVDILKISELYEYDGNKTVKKCLIDDIFED